MEHMAGVEMDDALPILQPECRHRMILDLVDLHDQLYRLRSDVSGSIYHSVWVASWTIAIFWADQILRHRSSPGPLRWNSLSEKFLHLLNTLCTHRMNNGYRLGPLNDINLLQFKLVVPTPEQTRPVFTSKDYVKLLAFNGNPTTRSDDDFPARDLCVELLFHVQNLYSNSPLLGPSTDTNKFFFSHGDLHGGNILVDPQTGALTGIIDWEAAALSPTVDVHGRPWMVSGRP